MNIRLPNQFALGANVKTKLFFAPSQSAKKHLILNMLFNANLEICNQRMATSIIPLKQIIAQFNNIMLSFAIS
jgi:hypothetical protein